MQDLDLIKIRLVTRSMFMLLLIGTQAGKVKEMMRIMLGSVICKEIEIGPEVI